MVKVLVETRVLAFAVVDLETEQVEEIVVMGDVAANVAPGDGCVWEDVDLDEDALTGAVACRARSIVEAGLSDDVPWRLLEQRA